MSSVILKNYQRDTLTALQSYLDTARFAGAKPAYEAAEKTGVAGTSDYKPLPDTLEHTPYVCLRLPTGAGKTLLSAYSVKLAAQRYLEKDVPLVLWLVPSNTIRQQTLETLRTPGHANHDTLHAAFGGQYTAVDIADFTMLRPHDIATKAVVVVATIQTLRVTNAEGRKVYAHHEDLEPHFSHIPPGFISYEATQEEPAETKFSFVNLLRMHRPLVIVDEAHNNNTKLAFEVLERIQAACVVEFTATPAKNSNVLHSVSASALKAEDMIKLPIILDEKPTWNAAVRDSILNRQRLEDLCDGEDRYIRPIVLFQAENKDKDITWQILKQHLMDAEHIPEDEIAVVTGDQRELDAINLYDPACPIKYIITVQALKEGWDCSFAYVFCSVANIKSATATEQILGRVLRMPYATRRTHPDLNKAYAHVSSVSWPDAVSRLHDKLVENMGFETHEAYDGIQSQPPLSGDNGAPLPVVPPAPVTVVLNKDAALDGIPEEDKKAIRIETTPQGVTQAVVTGRISHETVEKLIASSPDKQVTRNNIYTHQQGTKRASSPSGNGAVLSVPQLCFMVNGTAEFPDESLFLQAGQWALTGPEALSEREFSLNEDGKTFAIDILNGHLKHNFIATSEQPSLFNVDTGLTVGALAQWLDKRLRQADISQPAMLEYTRRTVQYLHETRGIPVSELARGQFLLQKVLEEKIKERRKAAKKKGFQSLLPGVDSAHTVSDPDYVFRFGVNGYHPSKLYSGAKTFTKHFYPNITHMNNEEAECAFAIEMQGDSVRHWIKNIERSQTAFRLPTSTDNFYPDFIVELTDDRILIIEYKGKDRVTNDDSKEKDMIGECWAKTTGNLFLLAEKKSDDGRDVFRQIQDVISDK